MSTHAAAIALAALALASSPVSAMPSASYDDLVASAQSDPAHADFTALRMAWARTPRFDPDNLGTRDAFIAMWKAYTGGDCATALNRADDILKANFTYMAAHAVRGSCLGQAGKTEESAREIAIGRGLADSILASGDGRTAATAYVVVALDEEHFVLSHLGVTEERQALLSANGHSYDRIDGKTAQAPTSVFFQIDEMMAGEARQLGH